MGKQGWVIGLVLVLAGLAGVGGYYAGWWSPLATGEMWRAMPVAPSGDGGGHSPGVARLALVIGNNQYTGEAVLTNAVNDAVAMRELLKQAKFDLMGEDNTPRQKLDDLITDFGRRLRTNGGVGVFYYSGHGMQVGGKNYLIPVDAQIRDEHDLPSRAVALERVLQGMDGRGPGTVNLVILDACRVNPFPVFMWGWRGLAL